jgi:ribosome-associated protein
LRAVRSSGPGGQNINKVASKVELHIDVERIVGLDDGARARLRRLTQAHQDSEGQLLVTSQRTRSQGDNLEDAFEKVRALVLRAMVRPKPRRATKPSRAARERRLAEKRHASDRKRQRRTRSDD